jgi:hypothetical protein
MPRQISRLWSRHTSTSVTLTNAEVDKELIDWLRLRRHSHMSSSHIVAKSLASYTGSVSGSRMKPRSTIFDSRSEREIFRAITGSWEPSYRVYPHIPYTSLIELDERMLQAVELSFLHKTTVDFVLTDAEGGPLLGIEFDGLGRGYSRDGQYLGFVDTPRDRARPWKLRLKTRVANDAQFPFIVVSYDEMALLDRNKDLIILHGVIGSFLSSKHLSARLAELVSENEDRLAEMSSGDAHDEIQDMILAAEIDLDMEWNPVTRRGVELQTEIRRVDPSARWRYSYLESPPRPSHCSPWLPDFKPDTLKQWWDNIERLGCEYIVTTRCGVVARAVWVRNYQGVHLTPFGMLEELAQVVALNEALTLLRA